MNEILDKILPYEARAEFCQIFRSFFGQWSFKKKCFWDLLTFNWLKKAYLFQDKDFSDLNDHDMKRKLSNFDSIGYDCKTYTYKSW